MTHPTHAIAWFEIPVQDLARAQAISQAGGGQCCPGLAAVCTARGLGQPEPWAAAGLTRPTAAKRSADQ